MTAAITAGVYPMLYAFFDQTGALDRAAHRRQVDGCIAAGAHGLAIGGLASECHKLSTDEKRQLMAWTLADTAGRVPVSVTVSENTVHGQKAMIAAAADEGAGWAVMQPPPVKSASSAALIDFFGAVADTAAIPMGIQNAPEYIGIGLENAALVELNRRHPQISILKAEGDALYCRRIVDDTNGVFRLFNGRNGIDLIDTLRAGFDGMIPSPDTIDVQSQIFEMFHQGRIDEAERAFQQILPLQSFVMTSIDHLLCYGKRLTAKRLGLGPVHDRGPSQEPHPFGLQILDNWSRYLGPLS
jgi:4-hydroxy-tetrahydrodipicolinate synthase